MTGDAMFKLFRDKPWLWIIVGLAFFIGLSLVFLVIALLNPPRMI